MIKTPESGNPITEASTSASASGSASRAHSLSQPPQYEAPVSPGILGRVFNRLSLGSQRDTVRVRHIESITHTLPASEQIEILNKVRTDILVRVDHIAHATNASRACADEKQALGELLVTSARKLGDGEISAGKTNLTKKPAQKAATILLSVLDPVALQSMDSRSGKKYTIAEPLRPSTLARFDPFCRELLSPQKRAAALVGLARGWEKYGQAKKLGACVASTLVDHLRDPQRSHLISLTEDQAVHMAKCLIEKVFRFVIKEVLVDPNRLGSSYTSLLDYDERAPAVHYAGRIPLPKYVLEAIQAAAQTLPSNDPRRNELRVLLNAVELPERADYCMASTWGDQDDCRVNPPYPDTPLVPNEIIDQYNQRLDAVRGHRNRVSEELHVLPAAAAQNAPPQYEASPGVDEELPPYA